MSHTITNCSGCGACCAHQGTPPFTRYGTDCPPPELDWDIQAHKYRYDQDLPCLWYDTATRTCKHYDVRPVVCRDFEVGGEDCLAWRETDKIPLPLVSS